jgi:helicase
MAIILSDQNNLVSTKQYPLGQYSFEYFNPVQSRMIDLYKNDCNVLVASTTGSGKTIVSEIVANYELKNGKVIYIAPMKALATEKRNDWSKKSHYYSNYKLSILTGDYRLTPDRKKELEKADLIMMTNEMLSSRIRNYKSENNEWLKDVSLIIEDEFHGLGTTRGPHTEIGLMKFCDINPKARIIGLSATMPNVEEIADWVATLNGKETYLIESQYRPCPLSIHWETYYDKGSYGQQESYKIEAAIDLVQLFPNDKFICFVHTKNTGEQLVKELKNIGVSCAYHNADTEKDNREKIENEFKNGDNLRVIVATSTLAWGCNLPARRVVVVGVHRGLEEVDEFDVKQECGRSGRFGLDPRGDAYVLVPERKSDYYIDKYSKPVDIKSRLLDFIGDEDNPHYKVLAFHLVSEIHHGEVKNQDDAANWFKKTLAYFQNKRVDFNMLNATLDLLKKFGAIKQENDEYVCTAVGKISSMFYYSPFDTADLRRNFRFLFDNNYQNNDIALSMALGAVDTIKMQYVTKAEIEEMETYKLSVKQMYGDIFSDSAIKGGYAHYVLLNGMNPGPFSALSRGVQQDFDRTLMVLNALDSMACNWNKKGWFYNLGIRVSYGVTNELTFLCRLPEVGKVRSEKLWKAGYKTYEDIINGAGSIGKILNLKQDKVDLIVADARKYLV